MRPTHSYLPALDQGEVRETTLDRVLIDQARLTPTAQALARVTEDGSLASAWSYGRLRADSVGLALALLSRFAPGERIAIRAGASPERARLVYAAAFAGLTVVAIPPGSPAAATSRILDHSGAAGLFIDGAQEAVAALRAELGAPAGVREVSGLGDEAALFAKRHAVEGLPEVRPDDPAVIVYGEGPEGAARGVRLNHRAVINAPRLALTAAGVRPGATGLSLADQAGAMSAAAFELGAAQLGCRLLLAGALEAGVALDLAVREGVSFILSDAAALHALCAAQARRPRALDALEVVVLTGAGPSAGSFGEARARLGCPIVTAHGRPETSGVIALATPNGQKVGRSGAACRPIAGMEVSIRDSRTNAIKAIGAPGEVCVRGFATMIGYNRDAAATAAAIGPDGWLRTGDLGAMDRDGGFVFTGRTEDTADRAGGPPHERTNERAA